jgi:hypothetical protein
MIRFRELIASVEWGEPGSAFRLTRIGVDCDTCSGAQLKTPDGQVLDLTEDEWRAVGAAVERLFGAAQGGEAGRKQKQIPPHAGQPWTEDLDKSLATLWREDRTVGQLAAQMGRTRGSISSRLVHLGLVEARDQAEQAERSAPAEPPRHVGSSSGDPVR